MNQYQKGKTSLDFTEARDSEWQWHQLGHMQVCTSLMMSVVCDTCCVVCDIGLCCVQGRQPGVLSPITVVSLSGAQSVSILRSLAQRDVSSM